jgi:hypothetical protein
MHRKSAPVAVATKSQYFAELDMPPLRSLDADRVKAKTTNQSGYDPPYLRIASSKLKVLQTLAKFRGGSEVEPRANGVRSFIPNWLPGLTALRQALDDLAPRRSDDLIFGQAQ